MTGCEKMSESSFSDIYSDKTVLVTGHNGFKGAWLTSWLLKCGAAVIGYSLEPPSSPSLFELSNIKDQIKDIHGDIRDFERLKNTFRKYDPDYIFHLAAQPLVRKSYLEPRMTYDTNFMGTLNVLECLRDNNNSKICIIVTSDKCYYNNEWIYGYRENDRLGGYDPYSASKACVELLVESYRNSFFKPDNYGDDHSVSISTVRAGNVVGWGDWGEDRLIPDLVKGIVEKKEVEIRNHFSVRPWQFVLEPLSGYLKLAGYMHNDSAKYSGAWNFGPDDENVVNVKTLIDIFLNYWGEGSYSINQDLSCHEANLLKLDISKSRFKLDWSPRYTIEETVKRTVNGYKQIYKGFHDKELYNLMIKEINEYTDKIK